MSAEDLLVFNVIKMRWDAAFRTSKNTPDKSRETYKNSGVQSEKSVYSDCLDFFETAYMQKHGEEFHLL